MKKNNQQIFRGRLRPLVMMIAYCCSQFAIANSPNIPADTRMGSWLVNLQNQPPSDLPDNLYPEATSWYSQAEITPQSVERQQLLDALLALSHRHAKVQKLATWAENLPATGRVQLSSADGRFLQANPSLEPVLQAGDSVQLFKRQNKISILLDDASICYADYLADTETKTYVNQCLSLLDIKQKFDNAYLILPSGQVEKVAIAHWNASEQIKPQPNSWIWLPNPKHGWSDHLASRFAKFLATQSLNPTLPQDSQIVHAHIGQEQLDQQKPSRDLPISPSDWGGVGLLQTPTARMNPAGTTSMGVTLVKPYTHYNFTLQPFDNLETTFRYTNTDGKEYGAVSPNQSHKDKSLDVKLRLLKESRWLPEVSVGWRDPLGTNLFAGEYLVGSKRYGDFDFSLGLGWGYLGARGDLNNPLNKLHSHFSNERKHGTGKNGGKVNPKNWFTGKTALFGGVQWHSPYNPLTLKLEYDGNNYQHETKTKYQFSQSYPINVGATWQGRHFDASLGWERGNELMLGLNLHTDISGLGREKIFASHYQDTGFNNHLNNFLTSGLSYRINFDKNQPAQNNFENLLQQFSKATGWQAFELRQQDNTWLIDAHFDQGVYVKDRLNQGLKLLSQYSPNYVKNFTITLFQHRVPVNRFEINRQDWQAQHQQLLPPSLQKDDLIQVNNANPENQATTLANLSDKKRFIALAPSLAQSLGGPDGYIFGLYASANMEFDLWKGGWLSGTNQLRLADNYDKYQYKSDSLLPNVRTNIHRYMTSSKLLMPSLQLNQFNNWGNNFYSLGYIGYLEPMFAGIGGELLYRRPNSPWAIGIDINRVKQRGFKQDFSLKDYEITTGHASLYYDTGIKDVSFKLSAGQYLAGDKGATLDIYRQFNNGAKIGAWATKTNISSEQFGEGSFDKGIYISIPFDALLQNWASGYTNLVYQPLLRDGGAMLQRRYTLYDLTSSLDKDNLKFVNPVNANK